MIQPYYDSGGITIFNASCLDVLPQLEAVDHVITDPPYASDVYLRMRNKDSAASATKLRVGAGLRAMRAGEIGAVDSLRGPVAAEVGRLVKRWALVFSDVETAHLWRSDLEASGMRYARTGAWVKPDAMPQMTGDRPGVGFEPCTITHAYGPMRWNGGGHLALWTHFTAKGAERPDHPCPKPIALMRTLIEQFTDPCDLILDPFMGSGTTLRAAKDLGRRAIGIEINLDYVKIAVERLRQSVMAL